MCKYGKIVNEGNRRRMKENIKINKCKTSYRLQICACNENTLAQFH